MKNFRINISLSTYVAHNIRFEQSKNPVWISFYELERDSGSTIQQFNSLAFRITENEIYPILERKIDK